MIVSIDIGTSYSSICMLGPEGKVLPVDIGTGIGMYGSKYSLPSAVFVDESGNVLVGQAAMNSRRRAPQNFRMEFKRDLGQNVPIILGSRSFLPKDLYTEIFRHMVKRAVQSGGEAIERAYVTYPASFGKKKKAQIIEAANAAGLFEVEMVDEPTAAAMSYVQSGLVGEEQMLLIYDFGGGTFDASLIGYRQGNFYSLADPVGLEHCGGIDIDRMIFEDILGYMDSDILAQVNKAPMNRMRLDSQFAELAVKAKHHLSSTPDFYEDIQVGFDLVPYQLSTDALNARISPLVSQTIEACRSLLKAAGLTVSQISAILMVGGTSRIPLVQSFVRQFAGNTAVRSTVDLELAVVQGALGFYKGDASRANSALEKKAAALQKTQQLQPKNLGKQRQTDKEVNNYTPEDEFELGSIGENYFIRKYIGHRQVVSIPPVIRGKKVVRIGKRAFSAMTIFTANHTLRKIIIPESITEIDSSAFWGASRLEEVIAHPNIKKIGYSAFASCDKLRIMDFGIDRPENKIVKFPKELQEIGTGAFAPSSGVGCLIKEAILSRSTKVNNIPGLRTFPLRSCSVFYYD